MDIIPKHNLDYGIPKYAQGSADKLTAAMLLHQSLDYECIIPVSKDGELIASLIRENGLNVVHNDGKIYLKEKVEKNAKCND